MLGESISIMSVDLVLTWMCQWQSHGLHFLSWCVNGKFSQSHIEGTKRKQQSFLHTGSVADRYSKRHSGSFYSSRDTRSCFPFPSATWSWWNSSWLSNLAVFVKVRYTDVYNDKLYESYLKVFQTLPVLLWVLDFIFIVFIETGCSRDNNRFFLAL